MSEMSVVRTASSFCLPNALVALRAYSAAVRRCSGVGAKATLLRASLTTLYAKSGTRNERGGADRFPVAAERGKSIPADAKRSMRRKVKTGASRVELVRREGCDSTLCGLW